MSDSTVLHASFYSASLEREKRYCLYLPPSYRQRPDWRYSSLYLLPGLMDYERTWVDKGHVNQHMDELLQARRLGEMIIVMPDKDDAALDEQREADFARYLGQELVDHIDATYRTIPVRHHRGIEGLSLGAGWAIRMGLKYPELYCSVGCLSGGFDEEMYQALHQHLGYLHRHGFRLRVGVGNAETEILEDNLAFVRYARGLGFYCELDRADGPHDWELWDRQVRNSLQFHYYSFNPR